MESSGEKKSGVLAYTKKNFTTKWKNLDTGGKVFRVSSVLVVLVILSSVVNQNPEVKKTEQSAPVQDNAPANASVQKPALPKYGDTIKAGDFEVTLNGHRISDRVDTGNEFTNIAQQEGNQFFIMNVTFKNISDKTKMAFPGSVYIEHNGKTYKYNNPETVMLEGWGMFLEQLNPLTSKTTRLVYKIPTEIKGAIYWEPTRGSRFSCGEL